MPISTAGRTRRRISPHADRGTGCARFRAVDVRPCAPLLKTLDSFDKHASEPDNWDSMTVEERFERIEHVTEGLAEARSGPRGKPPVMARPAATPGAAHREPAISDRQANLAVIPRPAHWPLHRRLR